MAVSFTVTVMQLTSAVLMDDTHLLHFTIYISWTFSLKFTQKSGPNDLSLDR